MNWADVPKKDREDWWWRRSSQAGKGRKGKRKKVTFSVKLIMYNIQQLQTKIDIKTKTGPKNYI